jgi:Tfp pilus assembly protein PilN
MQINLLPDQLKKKIAYSLIRDLKKIFLYFFILWVCLAVVSVSFVLKINGLKKKINKIEGEWNATVPLIKERDELAKRKQDLDKFLVFIKQNLRKGISWSEKLVKLSDIVPEEIWLNEFSLKKQKQKTSESSSLVILGSISYLATDEEMLGKINDFIEAIKKDKAFFKDFENLSIPDIQKAKGKDVERTMNFKLDLSLK